MKSSIERITSKGNSLLLFQLAERMNGNESQRLPSAHSSNANVEHGSRILSHLNSSQMSPQLNTGCSTITDSRMTSFQMSSNRDFFKMNSRVTQIEMKSGLCNEEQMEHWDLAAFYRLKELIVGDGCLQFVKELTLKEMNLLERVCVGKRCFTNTLEGHFDVLSCAALKSIAIGDGSCAQWSCFSVKECENVEEVYIGDGCFLCGDTVGFEGDRQEWG